ncbi:adenosylcobinamide-GDP ribazoletransferase [Fuscibacter oryzae]|uniref:Adenosylcobinamide-GDP ribazoletransferase n=1 Tax=Fuscibacter oryzae TaxID=2803939 RepID=A0A8J7SV91_9RHOB|nr:adenosylcobinamide-GDP ribazoletransferase [Fuscibacter oryzae]MBL4927579.1 adenosylcobinamide-GDP ribazoletransferase [Fuscibacter oryzae]
MQLRDLRHDLFAAFGLLTRLPMPDTGAPDPRAAWAWPLAGLAVGGLAVLAGMGSAALGIVPGVTAALMLGVAAALTGGLHEDGLADCADGFWGGRDKARRLEIMKDSRVGSYGVLALGIVLLARWSALTALVGAGHWGPVLAAEALSRAVMPAVMAALPNARGSGLSASHGAPGWGTAMQAAALAALLALSLAGWQAVPMILAAMLGTGAVALTARAKIGGQTGDVLGASQQIALTAALALAA